MTNQWFYRVFGEDFGPVPFDKLREMADQGTIGGSDEVRSADSDRWILAGTVTDLGLSSLGGATSLATANNSDTATDLSTNQAGLNDWYSQIGGQELGPFTFEELVKYAEQGNISAEDEVKLGASGKWRRVGSIGRLVAVLPYRPVESKTSLPGTKSRTEAKSKTADIERQETKPATPASSADSIPSVDERATNELAKAQIAKSLLAHAESAYKVAEESAKAELAWAWAPNVDPNWWCWLGGVEYGPASFMQVFDLAKSGQLKPSDFIRNGMAGQYFPASNAPGLFNAVAMLVNATEALRLATAQAQAATAPAVPVPKAPEPTVAKAPPVESTAPVSVVAPVTPQKAPGQTQPVASGVTERPTSSARPESSAGSASSKPAASSDPEPVSVEKKSVTAPTEPRSVTSSTSSNPPSTPSSNSSFSTARPVMTPARPVPKSVPSSRSSLSLSDVADFLKDAKVVGGAAAVVVLLLLYVGWQFIPKNDPALLKHYRELKKIADEIKAKRSANSQDFAALLAPAENTSKVIADDLKKIGNPDVPVSQLLLYLARDELPRLLSELKGTPAKISSTEENFISRLQEAAQQLGQKD